MTDEHDLASGLHHARFGAVAKHRHPWVRDVLKHGLTIIIGALLGAYTAILAFRGELTAVTQNQRDLLFILCNTAVPERAVGLVRACDGVRVDPGLRAFVREQR